MKEEYVSAEMEVIEFESGDVITASEPEELPMDEFDGPGTLNN